MRFRFRTSDSSCRSWCRTSPFTVKENNIYYLLISCNNILYNYVITYRNLIYYYFHIKNYRIIVYLPKSFGHILFKWVSITWWRWTRRHLQGWEMYMRWEIWASRCFSWTIRRTSIAASPSRTNLLPFIIFSGRTELSRCSSLNGNLIFRSFDVLWWWWWRVTVAGAACHGLKRCLSTESLIDNESRSILAYLFVDGGN